MTLANRQDLPTKKTDQSIWTRRSVFPVSAVISTVTKHFNTSLDIMCLISISSSIILELCGVTPWGLYALSALMVSLSFKSKNTIATKEKDHGEPRNN